jgi:hypothetical protein
MFLYQSPLLGSGKNNWYDLVEVLMVAINGSTVRDTFIEIEAWVE